jgi:class 3 adenylate cyclase
MSLADEPMAATFVLSIAGFVCWSVVAAVGSLLMIPIGLMAFLFVGSRILRMLRGRSLDDSELERKLQRFAREVGIGSVDVTVMKSERETLRTQMDPAPQILLYGRVIQVPIDIVHAGHRVLEYQLARAIVRVRSHHESIGFGFGLIGVTAAVGSIEAFARGDLLRLAGVASISDAGTLPAILMIVGVSRSLVRPFSAPIRRHLLRREIRSALDLTRDPAGALESFAYDRSGARGYDVWMRFLTGDLSENEVRHVVKRWEASRRLCLLFTDIVGSTEHLERLGDESWWEVLAEHDDRIRGGVAGFGGEEIQRTGDGFLIVFSDTGRAVLAAIEAQRRIAEMELPDGERLEVRMGLHAGDVILRGKDLVGREVHLAARIGSSARAGEILVSEHVRDELDSSDRFRFGEGRRVELKGFKDEHLIVPVEYERARVTLGPAA